MKQIEQYIESNKKRLEELIDEFEQTSPDEQSELKRINDMINKIEYYIKGLEDAKKYILEESE